MKTIAEYRAEIARVQKAIENTNSEHLKRDYGKYLKRLQREMRKFGRVAG